jgi:hypothetical protein
MPTNITRETEESKEASESTPLHMKLGTNGLEEICQCLEGNKKEIQRLSEEVSRLQTRTPR